MGSAACAVFGQLDLEIVHLIWELIGLFGTAICLYYFHKNIFLWIAFAALCWHALEHLTITYFYYFEQEKLWEGFKQLWATYPVAGNVYVAHPVGKEEAMLNFYQAGGKFGLMAKHGMFEQLTKNSAGCRTHQRLTIRAHNWQSVRPRFNDFFYAIETRLGHGFS